MFHNLNKWTRKFHRWGAIVCAIPMLIVIASGLILQLKKQVPWVQPPTQRGQHSLSESPGLTFDQILDSVQGVSSAGVSGWSDIERMDVRPGKGVVKVQCANRWEVQVDLSDGKVLSSTYRRSDLIESLHDGSFFADAAKLWIFFPNGVVLLILWVSGMWLWYLPIASRRKSKRRRAQIKTTLKPE